MLVISFMQVSCLEVSVIAQFHRSYVLFIFHILLFFLFLEPVSVLASKVMMEGCPLGQFPCGNTSVCLPQVLQCNGHRDCTNGEDEDHCGKYAHVRGIKIHREYQVTCPVTKHGKQLRQLILISLCWLVYYYLRMLANFHLTCFSHRFISVHVTAAPWLFFFLISVFQPLGHNSIA